MRRLNVLKVSDAKGDQTQSINESPIKLSAICMSPVELPYVSYFIRRDFYESVMGHWSGEIIYIGEDIPKIFFLEASNEIEYSGDHGTAVEVEKVEIDLSNTKLEKQKRELQDLFDSFQGLFLDKPWLTHVLYHKIDTGENPPVVSRPYRYGRVKQEILDYHVDKMLKERTKISIQSPYASPVVLCGKNNGLHTAG
ncbi:uncharacterized protein TNCV_496461 [Trichonephila clavipes]|nr:uncharacterized protein TNCV_496461 [Trichonephila clavipes]